MRLICGIFRFDGADASEELLRAMAAQMAVPRLKPQLTLWREGTVGLAVLDFSAQGAGPLPQKDTSVMAADVRLDDPQALRDMAGDGGALPEDALLLAALEKIGLESLGSVLGDFAFARWNGDSQSLTCARDVFGIRPLSYVHQPGRFFAFASFPRALHGSGLVPKRIAEDALARRMVRNFQADDAMIVGVKRLPPAHFLEVSRNGISLTRYWQLDRQSIGKRKIAPEQAAQELRRLVEQAVHCRLPPSAEIGAHLSGGLDSSAIAVLATRKLRQDGRSLHAYSFLDRQRNDITLEDETEFVKAVLEQEGDIDWTGIRPPAGIAALSGPMDADTTGSLDADDPENAVCARAEGQGVGVILSGWGGDEAATFNGRGAFAELFLRGRWRTLAREMQALKRERGWSIPRIFSQEVTSYLRPEGAVDFIKWAIGRETNLRAAWREMLTPSARRRMTVAGKKELSMAPDGRENRWRLMTSPHIAERAENWAQTGARHGLAFAFPLLDRRVVEFSLSLSSELFLRGGFRRRAFRDAMVGVLPERVRLRHQKYQPFPSRIIDIAESRNEILAQIDVYAQNENIHRMIDVARLRRQVEAFPSGEHLRQEMQGGDNPAAAKKLAGAMMALRMAKYIEQHDDSSGPSA